MSQSPSSNWFKQIPKWVWWAAFPGFGGLAIAYAGKKAKTNSWVALGCGLTGAALLLTESAWFTPIWFAQIGLAIYLKKPFLLKTYPKHLPLPDDDETLSIIADMREKVDINQSSKNELVYSLELPIVYANDIEELRQEGYIFTDAEELTELVGIPESTVRRIAPMIIFTYDYKKEANFSWRRLNTHSIEELVACGLDSAVAMKIVNEREKRGSYKTVLDVKRRTGLPLNFYSQIL
jgi:DNA uptake protein ComE-like DNA-binding protein